MKFAKISKLDFPLNLLKACQMLQMLYWKDISKLTVKAIRFATKSCLFKRPIENLDIGISASASSLELALKMIPPQTLPSSFKTSRITHRKPLWWSLFPV